MRPRKIAVEELQKKISEGATGKECAAHFQCSDAAISKAIKRLRADDPPPQSLSNLTQKEQKFCLSVAGGKTYTDAALSSFECSSRGSAKSIGSELMKRPEVELAIHDLMSEQGITRRYRLARLKQHIDSRLPDISLRALDQSWKLSGDYSPEKHLNLNIDISAENSRIAEIEARLEELRREEDAD